jgi:ATP-dependent phosphoenolpyruvate carboxykinase
MDIIKSSINRKIKDGILLLVDSPQVGITILVALVLGMTGTGKTTGRKIV